MAGQPVKQAMGEDALGDDILVHVTPKWVEWYRETLRRGTQDDEADERMAANDAQAASQAARQTSERAQR
jgi:hypothetical protein